LLDGRDLGGARRIVLWRPVPGEHLLTLLDGSGHVLDSLHFQIRGSQLKASSR
jgi:penicillin-binding protein 1C